MGDQRKAGIAWTDETWNIVRGCSLVSAGCTNCYAMRQAARMGGPGGAYEGLVRSSARGPVWTGKVRLVPELLDRPLRWQRPRRIFVNAMSDLFHESLTNEDIAAVFGVMAASPRHTFQVLTKRGERMRDWFRWADDAGVLAGGRVDDVLDHALWALMPMDDYLPLSPVPSHAWPLPNVWLGVSAEDQATWDERVPLLLETPAAVRWVSAEPLIGPIDTRGAFGTTPGGCEWTDRPTPDWVVCGGESGPRARPCDVAWVRSIVRQCQAASVPVFVKQLGAKAYDSQNEDGDLCLSSACGLPECEDYGCEHGLPRTLLHPKGGDPAEWTEDLRVREWPADAVDQIDKDPT